MLGKAKKAAAAAASIVRNLPAAFIYKTIGVTLTWAGWLTG